MIRFEISVEYCKECKNCGNGCSTAIEKMDELQKKAQSKSSKRTPKGKV